MYKYSMTQWINGNEPVEDSFRRLKKYGYDGIEMPADAPEANPGEICALMKKYGLTCTSLCGIFPESRNLTDPDPEIAGNAVAYIKDNVDYAVRLGAGYLIVVPSSVGVTAPKKGQSYGDAWKNAVDNIRKAADYADSKGIMLVIEGINRYETFLVNTLEQVYRLVKEIAHPGVGMMADLFHMSIEERSIEAALRMSAPYLRHVHIADNTREAAGIGTTDFKSVLLTLLDIGYKGALTMEFLPRLSNPYDASGMDTRAGLMDQYAEQSIRYMKCIEQSVSFETEEK